MKLNDVIAIFGALLVGITLGINGHELVYGQGIAQLGTMADWAMVGVTAVTLYFLYQQFAEMKKQTESVQIQTKVLTSQYYRQELEKGVEEVAHFFIKGLEKAIGSNGDLTRYVTIQQKDKGKLSTAIKYFPKHKNPARLTKVMSACLERKEYTLNFQMYPEVVEGCKAFLEAYGEAEKMLKTAPGYPDFARFCEQFLNSKYGATKHSVVIASEAKQSSTVSASFSQ